MPASAARTRRARSAGILAPLGLAGLHLADVALGGDDQGGVQAAPLLAGDLGELGVDLLGQTDGHFHGAPFRHATSVAAGRWRCAPLPPPRPLTWWHNATILYL